jgi:hypothetical protein
MTSEEQIITPEISQHLSKFNDLGGVLDFKFLKVSGYSSDLEAHLLTAQRTLELLGDDNNKYFDKLAQSLGTNRDAYFKVSAIQVLADTGIQISSEQFFGPYFNFKEERPILLGKTGKPSNGITVFSDYYNYDDIENQNNVVTVQQDNKDYVTQGYTDAFLSPPHYFGGKMTNLEIGKLFLAFNQFFFDDITKITVYSWPTDCSNYFEAGKEWWGSFFWTIYNPIKDWYVGIAASTTD